ncbi:MAG TPA: hypothetical protein VNL14_16565 [Candidatus Acidoferrales bacterium]|nr:hypothetical protein [Candidatus Acidoferrales bacterium]
MTEKDLRIVIPSRKRVESCRRAFRLVPSAEVCVAESEAEDYREFRAALTTHPDDVAGVSRVRRWILEHRKEKCVVIFDDDVSRVICLVGRKARVITDPVAVYRIIFNAASIAEGIGVSLFSFAITPNILNFFPYDPFGFLKANGPCLGFVGRRLLPDTALSHNTDADLTLQALLKDRIVWQDTRFMFEHQIMTNAGGNRHAISAGSWSADRHYLKRKWGAYLQEQVSGGVTRMVVKDVARRQKLELGDL